MALNLSLLIVALSVISYVTLGGQKGPIETPEHVEEIEISEEIELHAELEEEPAAVLTKPIACQYETPVPIAPPCTLAKPKKVLKASVPKKLKCSCTHTAEEIVPEPERESEASIEESCRSASNVAETTAAELLAATTTTEDEAAAPVESKPQLKGKPKVAKKMKTQKKPKAKKVKKQTPKSTA